MTNNVRLIQQNIPKEEEPQDSKKKKKKLKAAEI